MLDVMDAKDLFLAHASALEKHAGHDAFDALRQQGIEHFAELGLPTTRDEEWRFTPLGALPALEFSPGEHQSDLTAAQLDAILLPTGASHRVVLINGCFAAGLSSTGALADGVVVSSLKNAAREQRALVERHLGKIAQLESAPFAALNTGFLADGLFVYVPRGTVVRQPLHLVYVAEAADVPRASHPRTLIVCEDNAEATIVQSYVSRGAGITFTNAVSEIVLGPGAHLQHCKVQREAPKSFHFDIQHIALQRGSKFRSQAITLGGGLVRNEVHAALRAEACEATLNGLYAAGTGQHVDNRTTIDHAMPRCASHELYKGILDGKGEGVFSGKILVRQDAQKTDAKQTNKTLLLSDEAVIHTKPQLEIFADDVKCTHGATVGQVAAEALFYLRARGIGLREARAMLTFAFANEVLEGIPVAPLRAALEALVLGGDDLALVCVEESS
jgi:Fe-S cluster assembly protein SufD